MPVPDGLVVATTNTPWMASVSGSAVLGGILDVDLLPGLAMKVNESVNLLTAASINTNAMQLAEEDKGIWRIRLVNEGTLLRATYIRPKGTSFWFR